MTIKKIDVAHLSNGNPFLGVIKDFKYADKKIKVESGDRICIYSDGLIESANKENEMYDLKRVEDVIFKTMKISIKEATDYLKRICMKLFRIKR
jgi:sigma-B regulation protein RsbU (phosphoserine phosphatase)